MGPPAQPSGSQRSGRRRLKDGTGHSARGSDSASVLGGGLGGLDLLAQVGHEVGEPLLGDVEGLGTGDAREGDRGELVVVLLVLADDAGLAAQGAVDGQVAHLLDEGEVLGVGVGGTRVVAGLLDHDLLGADELGELLGEPLAGVDGVELDVAEGVALDLLAGRLQLGDDLGDAGALGQEDVDVALLVHDGLEALGLGGQVQLHLGQEDGVDVPALAGQAERRGPLPGGQQLVVAAGRLGGEVAAVAAHALVDDEHARVGAVLADDVEGEAGALLGRGPGAQGLADRDDVVVDGLGQADDGELVVVLVEVGGQVGGGGVGVVATDGVQDVDAVLAQLLGGELQGVDALLHQAALDEVLGVGELDAGVADRGPAEVAQDAGVLAALVVDDDVVAGEQAVVAVLVGDDLDLGSDLRVALDEVADGGGQTGGETASGEQGDATNRHREPFGLWVLGVSAPAGSGGTGRTGRQSTSHR